jgi:hypothetical protein
MWPYHSGMWIAGIRTRHRLFHAILIPPKILKPPRRQRRVASRVLDIAVPQVGLQRPRIDPVVGQLEPAGVPEHVGVYFDPEVSSDAGALDRTVEAFRR